MSFNNTTVNPSSFFTYNEAVNFINSINKCNTDKDCPYDSSCISNNCIVTFFCKDNEKCSLYETLCDGKPCKKDLSCKSNDECLSGSCVQDKCDRKNKYTSGKFTFDDGYNYYKNLASCKTDLDCPTESSCYNGECDGHFYCKLDDNKVCAFNENIRDGLAYFNNRECKEDVDCLSGLCEGNTCRKLNVAMVSKNTKYFGLDVGENCTKDSDCFSNYCRDNHVCGNIQNLAGVGYVLIGFIALIVVVVLAIIWCLCICCRRNKKSKNITQA